jgi:hypothetical protein
MGTRPCLLLHDKADTGQSTQFGKCSQPESVTLENLNRRLGRKSTQFYATRPILTVRMSDYVIVQNSVCTGCDTVGPTFTLKIQSLGWKEATGTKP